VPCFLISCLTILGFLLAPDSGEKLTLRKSYKHIAFIHSISSEITILLSVIMFSLLMSEIMPPSSNAIPIITIYFMCVMLMSTISVVASVIVISLHFRNAKNYSMPLWVSHIGGLMNGIYLGILLGSKIHLSLFSMVVMHATSST
jgi:nicotinic acetylcholine receptor